MRPGEKAPWPRLTRAQVVAWARAHRLRTGRWPSHKSGRIPERPEVNWQVACDALRAGRFGRPGESSLHQLLAPYRRIEPHLGLLKKEKITQAQILRWARKHFRQTGRLPTVGEGRVIGTEARTWVAIDAALRRGFHGLPGGSSLAKLLGKRPGNVRNLHMPRLSERLILRWADEHHRRTGRWPRHHSGALPDPNRETWIGIQSALQQGLRGLRGGRTLPRFLAAHGRTDGGRALPMLSPLTHEQILKWADEHFRRTGRYPSVDSGPVRAAPGEKWRNLESALGKGLRGLKGGSSVAKLLADSRGKRNPKNLPDLHVPTVCKWCKAHHRRTGQWPTYKSGPIPESGGDTWNTVQDAMQRGSRGMSGVMTLSELIRERFGISVSGRRMLDEDTIFRWARAHYRRYGQWPRAVSWHVDDAPGEKWKAIDSALREGLRGLPGGSSLRILLWERRTPASLRW